MGFLQTSVLKYAEVLEIRKGGEYYACCLFTKFEHK